MSWCNRLFEETRRRLGGFYPLLELPSFYYPRFFTIQISSRCCRLFEHFDSIPDISGTVYSGTWFRKEPHTNSRTSVAESHFQPDGRSIIAHARVRNDNSWGSYMHALEGRSDRRISFTLATATQLSYKRRWMMRHHCTGWKSDISLAILTSRTQKSVE